jgi:transketolase
MKSKSTSPTKPRDELCIDTVRMLAIDAVQKANSGHPGTPMALAPVAYTLWQKFLRYDPLDPHWPDRRGWPRNRRAGRRPRGHQAFPAAG